MVFDDQNTVQRKRAVIIGRNLRALRQKADKTLADVAQQVGISVSHLANAEHGRRTLGGENLRRVLHLYGFSLGVFLSHIERLLISDQREESTNNGAIEPLPILLIGHDLREPQLILLIPTYTHDEPEHLLLRLPPGSELWREHLMLPVRCTIACSRGALLVETPFREHLLLEDNILVIPPELPHRFRNHTSNASSAYIWVERAWL